MGNDDAELFDVDITLIVDLTMGEDMFDVDDIVHGN